MVIECVRFRGNPIQHQRLVDDAQSRVAIQAQRKRPCAARQIQAVEKFAQLPGRL